MTEGGEGLSEAMLVPAGVSASGHENFQAKEVGSLIIVDAVDFLATGGKEGDHFGSERFKPEEPVTRSFTLIIYG